MRRRQMQNIFGEDFLPDSDDDGNFLVFHDVHLGESINNSRENAIRDEIDNYLRRPTNDNVMEELNSFPTISALFMKFNCIRSSEAICERLFSFAGSNHFFSKIQFFILLCLVLCRACYTDTVTVCESLCILFVLCICLLILVWHFFFSINFRRSSRQFFAWVWEFPLENSMSTFDIG